MIFITHIGIEVRNVLNQLQKLNQSFFGFLKWNQERRFNMIKNQIEGEILNKEKIQDLRDVIVDTDDMLNLESSPSVEEITEEVLQWDKHIFLQRKKGI